MERVLTLGSGGAGRSTSARRLGALLSIGVTHLDVLYWRPGWQPTPDEEFASAAQAAMLAPRWIIDGNDARTLAGRKCDTAILLDYPCTVCILRALGRFWR